jgi:hypothetical protein
MRVLSIDLDYIVPSIENCSHDHDRYFHPNPTILWEFFHEYSNVKMDDIRIDEDNLKFCHELFLKSLKESKSVSFGYDHDSILYAIDDFENIELIHIDHHDDFLYGEFGHIVDYFQNGTENIRVLEYEQIVRNNHVNEGNWIGWLHANNKLSSYTWISNKNSNNNLKDLVISSIFPDYLRIEKEQFKLSSYKFDHIFVCLSPQYMPSKHWNYFTMFMESYQKITGKSAIESLIKDKKYEIEMRYSKLNQKITSSEFGILTQNSSHI